MQQKNEYLMKRKILNIHFTTLFWRQVCAQHLIMFDELVAGKTVFPSLSLSHSLFKHPVEQCLVPHFVFPSN
jgi:hypothetical protein